MANEKPCRRQEHGNGKSMLTARTWQRKSHVDGKNMATEKPCRRQEHGNRKAVLAAKLTAILDLLHELSLSEKY
ncbi:expressed protein [Arabidopsis lyrata subsp. lyrata]|uniref:Expressed protein n=1 Tax=Arabidopsis lyrata subsp. lyrata TaxID=81972 RepID=D7LNL2_ARALL|nr:expressed protein [Arabidopsis lyrata subsp. lyrata]